MDISRHHDLTLRAYYRSMYEWERSVEGRSSRCRECWLRPQDCFCGPLRTRRDLYRTLQRERKGEDVPVTVTVTVYYHYQEVGRSANTLHILPVLCPETCETLVFGDVKGEEALVQRIADEQDQERVRTCVLYPSEDSVSLAEWMETNALSPLTQTEGERPHKRSSSDMSINMVVLDGTYSHARRQMKHLRQCLCRVGQKRGKEYKLPVVRLDLEAGQCASAIIGVMRQPSGDKICSLQAVVMAMRQAGVDEAVCGALEEDLSQWLAHILESKIKFGKGRIQVPKVGERLGDPARYQPIDSVARFLQASEGNPSMTHTPLVGDRSCVIGVFSERPLHPPPRLRAMLILQPTYRFSVLAVAGGGTDGSRKGRKRQAKMCRQVTITPTCDTDLDTNVQQHPHLDTVRISHCRCSSE
mmetsp:Transcript_14554/g.21927  ORF Transcript_14554/g.21927 Transcript_14554/m.21927 type:complete len:414 (+) Transcript_14554:38-1279(+)